MLIKHIFVITIKTDDQKQTMYKDEPGKKLSFVATESSVAKPGVTEKFKTGVTLNRYKEKHRLLVISCCECWKYKRKLTILNNKLIWQKQKFIRSSHSNLVCCGNTRLGAVTFALNPMNMAHSDAHVCTTHTHIYTNYTKNT